MVSWGQIKNGVVIYKKQLIQKTFVNKEKGNANFDKFSFIENKMINALEEIEFKLRFTNNESLYERVKSLKTENDKFFRLALAPYGTSVFYSSKNSRLEQADIFGETFLVTKNDLKWKLLNEQKKIGDYNCFKAIARIEKLYKGDKKEYLKTAWYCPEINASFGPIGYSGLPGLILELSDGKHRYVASKIRLNPTSFAPIKVPSKGKKVTDEEMDLMFNKAMSNFKENRGN